MGRGVTAGWQTHYDPSQHYSDTSQAGHLAAMAKVRLILGIAVQQRQEAN